MFTQPVTCRLTSAVPAAAAVMLAVVELLAHSLRIPTPWRHHNSRGSRVQHLFRLTEALSLPFILITRQQLLQPPETAVNRS